MRLDSSDVIGLPNRAGEFLQPNKLHLVVGSAYFSLLLTAFYHGFFACFCLFYTNLRIS